MHDNSVSNGFYITPLMIIVLYNPPLNIYSKFNLSNISFVLIDNSEQINEDIQNYCQAQTNITYIPNKNNLGIAAALNIGCEFAIQSGYNWVITMDQDSIITQDIIDNLVKYAQKSVDLNNIAIISPRHLLQEDIKVSVKDELNESTDGLSTMTSGNLLNISLWRKLSGFKEELFIDMVDVEYYCRAILNGYRVVTLNHVVMNHALGNLETKKFLFKTLKVFNHGYIRKYYQIRNGLIVYNFYKNSVPEVKGVLRFIIGLVVTLPFEKDRIRKLFYMIKGVVDFLRNKTGKLNGK